MEKIITLKVDLEYPEEAKFAIDAAAKTYSDFKREQATRQLCRKWLYAGRCKENRKVHPVS